MSDEDLQAVDEKFILIPTMDNIFNFIKFTLFTLLFIRSFKSYEESKRELNINCC